MLYLTPADRHPSHPINPPQRPYRAHGSLPRFGLDMTPEWGPHNVQPVFSPSAVSAPSINMAAVASSSRLAVPRTAPRARKQDVFKPRFPLDPFAGVSTALGEPWFLKVDALLVATAHQRRNVFFVLGGAPHCVHRCLSVVLTLCQPPP